MTYLVNYPIRHNRKRNTLSSSSFYPAVNVSEGEDGWSLGLAAPGLNKEDFKVEVIEGKLTISYEGKAEEKEGQSSYSRKEFGVKPFSRSFVLPKTADSSNISANYEQGILGLSVPKKEEAKPQLIAVEVA